MAIGYSPIDIRHPAKATASSESSANLSLGTQTPRFPLVLSLFSSDLVRVTDVVSVGTLFTAPTLNHGTEESQESLKSSFLSVIEALALVL